MSRSKDWKERRAHVLPGRTEYAKRVLRSIGIYDIREEKCALIISYNDTSVLYSPFTGFFRGKGVGQGRGLEELICRLCQI